MKKTTVDILDAADAFEDRLNWQLFKIEQDSRLFARMESPTDWYPGFPIHPYPKRVYNLNQQFFRLEVIWRGNIPREMFDIFDIDDEDPDDYYIREDNRDYPYRERYCVDCEVWWKGIGACWICKNQKTAIAGDIEVKKLDIGKGFIYILSSDTNSER